MKKIIGLVLALTLVLGGLTTASAGWLDLDIWVCRNCDTAHHYTADFCTNCGAARPSLSQPTFVKWTCPKCDTKNSYSMDFCANCGTAHPSTFDPSGTAGESWNCENCGAENTGNYCGHCGSARLGATPDAPAASESWVCPSCGTENTTKFCGECGAARPSETWICPSCGAENTTKFCGECGAARPSAEATQPPASEPSGGGDVDSSGAVLNTRLYSRFIPEVFIENLNSFSSGVAEQLFPDASAEELAILQQYLTVSYDEIEGNAVYYDNPDRKVEAAAIYYSGTPDLNAPADELCVSCADDLDGNLLAAAQYAMVLVAKDCDPTVSGNDIADWMRSSPANGDTFPLTGCFLAAVISDGSVQYTLVLDPGSTSAQ